MTSSASSIARPKRLPADRFGGAGVRLLLSSRKINAQALSFWLRLERLWRPNGSHPRSGHPSQEAQGDNRPQISRLYVDADCRTVDSLYHLPGDDQRTTAAEQLCRPRLAAAGARVGPAGASHLL